MRKGLVFLYSAVITILFAMAASAQEKSPADRAQHLLDSTRLVEGHIFAPDKFAKAEMKFEKARESIDRSRKQSLIDKYFNESIEFAEQTLSASATTKLTLEEYLAPREKAKAANSPSLVPELYQEAEEQFIKATSKIEAGDVKGGLKEAVKANPLFDVAEFEAIRVDIMGTADKLIAKAIEGEAEKYALSTLDKARTARSKCDIILTRDRYERDESTAEIKRAEYEARHALQISTSVRSLERNDQAWEKLILGYEIEMDRVAKAIGANSLPFDRTVGVAADSLIYHIEHLQTQSASTDQTTQELVKKLKGLLTRLDSDNSGFNPVDLTNRLDIQITHLMKANETLANRLSENEYQFSQLQEDHTLVSAELEERTSKEEKFRKAKELLTPSEGEVLFNASNDIVLRLSGLSFDVNRSDIKDEHGPLLQKVKTIIGMFGDSKLIVEGHTDASGDPSGNLALSEKRAFSVMQYLRQSLLISAERITAIGYGSDKPIASNKTNDGRAKNRRIDILIMQ